MKLQKLPVELPEDLRSFTSTELKNNLSTVLDGVQYKREVVLVTRKNGPSAVLIPLAEYERLRAAAAHPLAALEKHFDGLVARMQTAEAKAGVRALFDASPEQLGEAAVRGAPARR